MDTLELGEGKKVKYNMCAEEQHKNNIKITEIFVS